MPWPPKTGATHYHAQLGLPDKGRAINGLDVCWSMARINEYGMGLWTSARCVVWSLLWSGWQSSSSTATPHRLIKHLTKVIFILLILG